MRHYFPNQHLTHITNAGGLLKKEQKINTGNLYRNSTHPSIRVRGNSNRVNCSSWELSYPNPQSSAYKKCFRSGITRRKEPFHTKRNGPAFYPLEVPPAVNYRKSSEGTAVFGKPPSGYTIPWILIFCHFVETRRQFDMTYIIKSSQS